MYDDDTASSDIGAFLCGRAPVRIESLTKCLACTRQPALGQIRAFRDVPKDSAAYLMYANDEFRQELLESVASIKAAGARAGGEGIVAALRLEKKLLAARERVLEYRVLDTHRRLVWDEGCQVRKSSGYMSKEQLAALVRKEDLSAISIEQVLAEFGSVIPAIGSSRAEKVQRWLAKRARQNQTRCERGAAATRRKLNVALD